MKKAPGKSLDYVISEKWRTEALAIAGKFSPAGYALITKKLAGV